jgi:cellulose biosynthesis protein BcsQ
MQILTIFGRSGGRTTTCLNLAVIAASNKLSVGIIDGDPARSLSHWYNIRRGAGFAHLGRDITLLGNSNQGLEEMLNTARQLDVDWVIIDSAPALGHQIFAEQRIADVVLIPTGPGFLDLRVSVRCAEKVRFVGCKFAVVINNSPPCRDGLDAPIVRVARNVLKAKRLCSWRGQITRRLAVMDSVVQGQGVVESDPLGRSTYEYRKLWNAVVRLSRHDEVARVA